MADPLVFVKNAQFAQENAERTANDLALPPQPAQLPDLGQNSLVGLAQPDSSFPEPPPGTLPHEPHIAPQVGEGLADWSDHCPEESKETYGAGMADRIQAAVSPVLSPRDTGASPLEWLLSRGFDRQEGKLVAAPAPSADGREFSPQRVLAYLIQAEAHEPDVWERENYRQSFICLTLALRGNTQPFVVSSYQMYGVHPDKLFQKIETRRAWMLGTSSADAMALKTIAGSTLAEQGGAAKLRSPHPLNEPSPIKKPVESVGRKDEESAA